MSWLMSPIIFGTTVIEKLVYVRRGYLNALLGVVKVIFRQADMLAKLFLIVKYDTNFSKNVFLPRQV